MLKVLQNAFLEHSVILMTCNKQQSVLKTNRGDKNSTRPLLITSEILKGRVILPKALVLQDECFGKNYSRKSYYTLMFFIVYAFRGQVHGFAGPVKIVCHLSCRTSAILKYFCHLQSLVIF